jgi:RHS repeat-associated protein
VFEAARIASVTQLSDPSLAPMNGNDHLCTREYDARAVRFLSLDPLGFEAGDTTRYRYANNNPLSSVDPGGMNACEKNDCRLAGALPPFLGKCFSGYRLVVGQSNVQCIRCVGTCNEGRYCIAGFDDPADERKPTCTCFRLPERPSEVTCTATRIRPRGKTLGTNCNVGETFMKGELINYCVACGGLCPEGFACRPYVHLDPNATRDTAGCACKREILA